MLDRRHFIKKTMALGGASALSPMLPAWAKSAGAVNLTGIQPISGNEFHLRAGRSNALIDGKRGKALTINDQLPAPLLRWREGEDVTLHLSNDLDEDTSIHWHGILLPPGMDGVPGLSGYRGVTPGETFTYKFHVKQAGTYWYHSHSGMQEQLGHYGPIIIEPKGTDPVAYDREYVIVLSDWTFEKPSRLMAKLKKNPEVYNRQRRTVMDFFRDADRRGLDNAFAERAMWGNMRMDPADIADVTAATYTYLVNGHAPGDNWTGLFNPGERVRLRIINASAMTIFNVRLPGLPMTVVQADGLNVRPVETDEFQIGVAETYDVIVSPREDRAYTLMAETIDRSGFARATLAPRPGMEAPIPPLRDRPTLTMADMAMSHGAMEHNEMEHGSMKHEPAGKEAMDHGSMDHSGHSMEMPGVETSANGHNHKMGSGVDMVAEIPTSRLHEPGLGLETVPHRALSYTQLAALEPNPDKRAPEREMELHLTGNMHRYMWSFDGVKFSEVDGPIELREGERVRLTLVNDTMMSHPIHLHGMFFDVVTQEGAHKPRKHTIIVKPGEKLSVDITADAVGDWAFHCHLLYHMMSGMMRVVSVKPARTEHDSDHQMDHSNHDMGTL